MLPQILAHDAFVGAQPLLELAGPPAFVNHVERVKAGDFGLDRILHLARVGRRGHGQNETTHLFGPPVAVPIVEEIIGKEPDMPVAYLGHALAGDDFDAGPVAAMPDDIDAELLLASRAIEIDGMKVGLGMKERPAHFLEGPLVEIRELRGTGSIGRGCYCRARLRLCSRSGVVYSRPARNSVDVVDQPLHIVEAGAQGKREFTAQERRQGGSVQPLRIEQNRQDRHAIAGQPIESGVQFLVHPWLADAPWRQDDQEMGGVFQPFVDPAPNAVADTDIPLVEEGVDAASAQSLSQTPNEVLVLAGVAQEHAW